ncbi:MAG: NeuD/PglB/VioB family sugar acetyltransferase [Bacteroidales bacterium]|nr:NeuD/PglB/VioB family sugar acetyltransferase [Bacteroidales bacterium]
MKNIVLFGGGTHVRYCIDIIEKENKYNIVGITDPYLEVGTKIMGYYIIGKQEELKSLIKKHNIEAGIITIGDNWTRKIVLDEILNIDPDFEFVSTIHPSVILGKNVNIGKGTIMMAGCIVNPNTTIGNFCFFATGAILEHDCYMGNFASISAGSLTGGKVKIGEFVAIALGVVLLDRIEIGDHTVIGSGSLVTKSIAGYVVAYGSPAKIIRSRKKDEKFLKS